MNRPGSLPLLVSLVALLALLAGGCAGSAVPMAHVEDGPPASPGVLSAHLHNGGLAVLTDWREEDGEHGSLVGSGTVYDAVRTVRAEGMVRIPRDSIVLLETTAASPYRVGAGASAGRATLAFYTVLTGALTLVCLADPKSCFGSCPTFYAEGAPDRPVAEGFSGSVARVLEARDIDALPGVVARNGEVRLRVRNEAMETHALRRVALWSVPAKEGAVAASPAGDLLRLREIAAPVACVAAEGDCLAAVRQRDGLERRSWTDSTDLAAREGIELTFDAEDGPLALVISARHTLVSTFVFYQTLAYLGADAGTILADLERGRGTLLSAFRNGARMLGNLDVQMPGPEGWHSVATYAEEGPLAADVQVLPLPPAAGPVRIRLDLTRGYWRLDQVALARVDPSPVRPEVLEVARVERDGVADEDARALLLDPDSHLVTYPGDVYDLVFRTPPGMAPGSFFLETTGYYYEWMRREWLPERDPGMVALLALRPHEFFRRLAPAFKATEAGMDTLFWASRFGRR